jgi:ribose/xylose/arabinose/galactoside ABC-type transport system permease subunit
VAVRSTPAVSDVLTGSRIDRRRLALFAVRYSLFLALGLWIIFMTIMSEHFLSWLNFLNVARQAAPVVVVAVGMTFVMATAGIDLSVGSLVALVSVLSAALLTAGLPVWVVIPAVLALGVLAGLVNGAFVRLGLPAFIVTLAALTYLRGIAFVASDGYAVPIRDEVFLWFGRGQIGGIHVPIVLAVIVALIGYVVLNKTRFGLYALAVGGREEAARAMGIDIGRIRLAVYAGIGLLAALGGIVATARLGNGSPNAGIMFELDVIAATVLGGTSLFGGFATIGGTVAGALFINFVRNGLNLLGVNPFWVQVVTGVILLLAVLVNTVINRRVIEWARLAGAEPEPAIEEDEEDEA